MDPQETARLALDMVQTHVVALVKAWNTGDLPETRRAVRDIHSSLKTIENIAKDQLWNSLDKGMMSRDVKKKHK